MVLVEPTQCPGLAGSSNIQRYEVDVAFQKYSFVKALRCVIGWIQFFGYRNALLA